MWRVGGCLVPRVGFLEPFLVRVLFPSVFVKVLVEVFVQFLVLFGHFDGERDFN